MPDAQGRLPSFVTKLLRRLSRKRSEREAESDLRRADDEQRDKDAMFEELLSITYRGAQGP